MASSSMRLRRRILGISPDEATFARRGFRCRDVGAREQLERIGTTFLRGYHAALEEDDPNQLEVRLAEVEAAMRGFAFEGAAMGVSLRDCLAPWGRSRLKQLLAGAGGEHVYMIHVGAGWAWARLPWTRVSFLRSMAKLDPLLGWLALDGYGFHEGYFHSSQVFKHQSVPRSLKGYSRRVFDQGLGRSLWFVEGADVDKIAATIGSFPATRHGDLWAGIGLACAYAGGVESADLHALLTSAGPNRPHVAQGAAFAAKARQRAGNTVPHTELACEVLCGLSLSETARVTDDALVDLPADAALPAFESWRTRIRSQIARELVTP